MWRGWLPLFLLLAGCAELPKAPETQPERAELEKEAAAVEEPKFKNSTLKYLANRNLKPQPTRPLNVKSRCTHRDAIGTATKLDLLVREAVVKTFSAQVSMKGYGTCRFDLNDFDQAEKMPQALLRHKTESGCLVRLWEQGDKVTIAFNSCPKSCERDAFSYLWPIMVEAKSGRCF
jgi:ssDNA-binding Zn-finger/Zn-ribbon topoisomerase 1